MDSKGIFDDLVVIELASVLAGPSVGMFFAELGARVIKVENFKSGGDVTRSWKLPGENSSTGVSSYFSSVNWGKQSIGINLQAEAGRKIVYELIDKADILLTSYKHGDAEKLGMDAATLCKKNPRLIYAAITAYGDSDPRTGFDAIIQAEGGFMFMNGTPESGPLKMPVALMDLLAAHQLKEAILVALIGRMKTGKGASVSASLLESAIASLANQATNFLVGGKIPGRMGSGHPNIVPYGSVYLTADQRHLVLAIGNDKQFHSLCDCIGQPELKSNQDYATNASRVNNRQALEKILSDSIAGHSLQPLLDSLLKNQVPAGAVLNMKEVFEQPQARQMLLHHSAITGVKTIAFRAELPATRPLSPPPGLCEHTEEVLKDFLSYSLQRIESAKKDGGLQ